MQFADFALVVAPLAVMVYVLVFGVFYFARRKDKQDVELGKLKTLLHSGDIDKKTFQSRKVGLTQRRAYLTQVENLHEMLRQESIDKETYVRLRKILSQGKIAE